MLNLALALIYGIAAGMTMWIAFAGYRLFGLTREKAYRARAAEWDREDFGFWLGALLSSIVLTALFMITPIPVG
jgi:hypothetical protein